MRWNWVKLKPTTPSMACCPPRGDWSEFRGTEKLGNSLDWKFHKMVRAEWVTMKNDLRWEIPTNGSHRSTNRVNSKYSDFMASSSCFFFWAELVLILALSLNFPIEREEGVHLKDVGCSGWVIREFIPAESDFRYSRRKELQKVKRMRNTSTYRMSLVHDCEYPISCTHIRSLSY